MKGTEFEIGSGIFENVRSSMVKIRYGTRKLRCHKTGKPMKPSTIPRGNVQFLTKVMMVFMASPDYAD